MRGTREARLERGSLLELPSFYEQHPVEVTPRAGHGLVVGMTGSPAPLGIPRLAIRLHGREVDVHQGE